MGVQSLFLKSFGGMKAEKVFESFIMNCVMTVLIKLNRSKNFLNQKSLKLMKKNSPSL